MESISAEARVILALEAIQKDNKLSIRAAAKIYNVPATTICHQCDSRTIQCNTIPNLKKLTNLEEQAIVQYIIKLSMQSFPPRLHSVKDIANNLLYIRDAPPVGKNWASNFVNCQPELYIYYVRKYNY